MSASASNTADELSLPFTLDVEIPVYWAPGLVSLSGDMTSTLLLRISILESISMNGTWEVQPNRHTRRAKAAMRRRRRSA